MGREVLRGILWTHLGIFPAAILVGLAYRFPVPFRGYVEGFRFSRDSILDLPLDAWMIALGTAFYVVFGGFAVLAILGVVAGLIGWRLGRPDRAARPVRGIALGLAFVVAALLSVLDKLIGPW